MLAEKNSTSSLLDIERLIRRLGLPGIRTGFKHLVLAVQIAADDPDALQSASAMIYPVIAQRYGATTTQVVKSIQRARDVIWSRGDRAALDEMAGYHLIEPPTPVELIDYIAFYYRSRRG